MENNELALALNKFQSELVTVNKNSNNPFYNSKYADLAEIQKVTQPILTKHGLSVIQLPDNVDGKPALTTIVMHTSGQHQKGTIPLPPAKDDPQGVGSAITYMRRYSYAAALQIVIDEDDDANRASRPPANTKTDLPTDKLATPKQRNLILKKLTEMGIQPSEMKGYLNSEFGITDSEKMSMKDASMVIESLIGEAK